MTKNKDFSVTGSLAGKCLISMRGMTDPRFEKSVIYICSHAPDEGAMGFVINKPAAHVAYSEILLQLGLPLGDIFWRTLRPERARSMLCFSWDIPVGGTVSWKQKLPATVGWLFRRMIF